MWDMHAGCAHGQAASCIARARHVCNPMPCFHISPAGAETADLQVPIAPHCLGHSTKHVPTHAHSKHRLEAREHVSLKPAVQRPPGPLDAAHALTCPAAPPAAPGGPPMHVHSFMCRLASIVGGMHRRLLAHEAHARAGGRARGARG